jgi:DNA-binding CsgD family transcriptional regulator
MPRSDSGRLKLNGTEFGYVVSELTPPQLTQLTATEREVALLVCEGLSNKEIATKRSTSPHTVGNQLASIFTKLQVGHRYELIAQVSAARRKTFQR